MAEAVAFDGTGFMAAWGCGTAICGARVTATGGAVEAHTLVTTVGTPSHVRLASDGSQLLVVWAETRDRPDIYAARVTPDSQALDPGGFVVSRDLVSPGGGFQRTGRSAPEVAFDGSTFTVAWLERIGHGGVMVFTARVTGAGELLDPAGVYYWGPVDSGPVGLALDGAAVALAASDGRYLLSLVSCLGWTIWPSGVYSSPDVSVGASSVLVVFDVHLTWAHPYAEGVFGHFVGAPTASLLHLAPAAGAPLTAWDGAEHLVVWTDAEGVVGLRVSPSAGFAETYELCDPPFGCVSFPMPTAIAPGAATALASNGRGVSLVTIADAGYLLVTDAGLALADALEAATALVDALDPAALKNANQQRALGNKVASIGRLVAAGQSADALLEVTRALGKTDGCALALSPDADDWIRTCEAQRGLYATLSWIRELLEHAP
ncbi:MAG TPA: hypothetical protein VFP50_03120 [Anaeromyxobacteraceae bacterium]|nr:hypothetical protein [Anaeromyxobacteraceae bacterium]